LIGAGEVILKASLNKHEKNPVKLKGMLCEQSLRHNLLSVAKITDNGYTVTFRKHHATDNRSDDSIAFTATKYKDLYIVNDREEASNCTSNSYE